MRIAVLLIGLVWATPALAAKTQVATLKHSRLRVETVFKPSRVTRIINFIHGETALGGLLAPMVRVVESGEEFRKVFETKMGDVVGVEYRDRWYGPRHALLDPRSGKRLSDWYAAISRDGQGRLIGRTSEGALVELEPQGGQPRSMLLDAVLEDHGTTRIARSGRAFTLADAQGRSITLHAYARITRLRRSGALVGQDWTMGPGTWLGNRFTAEGESRVELAVPGVFLVHPTTGAPLEGEDRFRSIAETARGDLIGVELKDRAYSPKRALIDRSTGRRLSDWYRSIARSRDGRDLIAIKTDGQRVRLDPETGAERP